jgi:hypothetical protein
MITTQADVLVHIGEPIDDAGRSRIAGALASLDGVRDVRSAPRTRNLLVVFFEPDTASTRDVLHAVQSQGFTASLVGF